jgi:hypothetical protein
MDPCTHHDGHLFRVTVLDGEPSQLLAHCERCLASALLAPDYQWHPIAFGVGVNALYAAANAASASAPAPVAPASEPAASATEPAA